MWSFDLVFLWGGVLLEREAYHKNMTWQQKVPDSVHENAYMGIVVAAFWRL